MVEIDDVKHARPGDVAGGEQGEEKLLPSDGLMEFDHLQAFPGDAVASLQQMSSDWATEDVLVSRDVIGVGMRHKGVRLGVASVEPEVGIGEMQFLAGAEADFVSSRHAETIRRIVSVVEDNSRRAFAVGFEQRRDRRFVGRFVGVERAILFP